MSDLTSVAACCCAHLLRDSPVQFHVGSRPRVPAIVIGEATQSLVCDVFGRPELFRNRQRIERRIVAWGPNSEPVDLPHQAVLISESDLVGLLQPAAPVAPGDSGWTIHTSRPLPTGVVDHPFGTRQASAVAVEYSDSACWVESLTSGWLFLLPGWLIAVGGAPESLLSDSCLVARQIRGVGSEVSEFPAYPRIADPLCGPGWLACGSAAMAFDPICGDGTGNAVREAILASAVVRAARREPVDALLAHYRSRLIAGFRRHLEISLQFYRAGRSGPWWDAEIEALEHGMTWCARQLAAHPAYRYRLNGFDLEPATAR